MRQNHNKIICIKLVHLPYFTYRIQLQLCLLVYLPQKFSAAANVLTVSFIANNSKHVARSRVKVQFYRPDCHKRSNREDVFCGVCFLIKRQK